MFQYVFNCISNHLANKLELLLCNGIAMIILLPIVKRLSYVMIVKAVKLGHPHKGPGFKHNWVTPQVCKKCNFVY